MWKIFYKHEKDIKSVLDSIEKSKSEVFSLLERDVKDFFSRKVIVYFDNSMLFKSQQGLHFNLMNALSQAEEDMFSSSSIFPKIEMYWMKKEDGDHFLFILGLPDDKDYVLELNGFELIEKDKAIEDNKKEKFESESWKTLIFHTELVNYSNGWVAYIPDLLLRTKLQTEYILLNAQLKKSDLDILEMIKFKDEIKNHSSYNELYDKLLKILPKIEENLKNESKQNAIPIIEKTKNKKKI